MKLKSTTIDIGYPVYGAKFVNDDVLIVAGGGGEGKNGIPNKITALRIQPNVPHKVIKKYRELVLDENEDCPMSLDCNNNTILLGVNEASSEIKNGVNKHLRMFKFHNEHLKPIQGCQIHPSKNPQHYQKLTAVTRDGTLGVIVMSDSPSSVYIVDTIDELEEKFKVITNGDVKDISISPDGKMMCYITGNQFQAISTITGRPVHTTKLDFTLSKVKFYDNNIVVLAGTQDSNIVLAHFSISKSAIIKKNVVVRKLKGLTSMDVNPVNGLVSLAGSDCSVTLVRFKDLKLIKKFDKVHGFAITKITSNDKGTYLASVSAANSVNVLQIPEKYAESKSLFLSFIQMLLSIVLVGALGVGLQYSYENGYIDKLLQKAIEFYNSRKPADSSSYFTVEPIVGSGTGIHTKIVESLSSETSLSFTVGDEQVTIQPVGTPDIYTDGAPSFTTYMTPPVVANEKDSKRDINKPIEEEAKVTIQPIGEAQVYPDGAPSVTSYAPKAEPTKSTDSKFIKSESTQSAQKYQTPPVPIADDSKSKPSVEEVSIQPVGEADVHLDGAPSETSYVPSEATSVAPSSKSETETKKTVVSDNTVSTASVDSSVIPSSEPGIAAKVAAGAAAGAAAVGGAVASIVDKVGTSSSYVDTVASASKVPEAVSIQPVGTPEVYPDGAPEAIKFEALQDKDASANVEADSAAATGVDFKSTGKAAAAATKVPEISIQPVGEAEVHLDGAPEQIKFDELKEKDDSANAAPVSAASSAGSVGTTESSVGSIAATPVVKDAPVSIQPVGEAEVHPNVPPKDVSFKDLKQKEANPVAAAAAGAAAGLAGLAAGIVGGADSGSSADVSGISTGSASSTIDAAEISIQPVGTPDVYPDGVPPADKLGFEALKDKTIDGDIVSAVTSVTPTNTADYVKSKLASSIDSVSSVVVSGSSESAKVKNEEDSEALTDIAKSKLKVAADAAAGKLGLKNGESAGSASETPNKVEYTSKAAAGAASAAILEKKQEVKNSESSNLASLSSIGEEAESEAIQATIVRTVVATEVVTLLKTITEVETVKKTSKSALLETVSSPVTVSSGSISTLSSTLSNNNVASSLVGGQEIVKGDLQVSQVAQAVESVQLEEHEEIQKSVSSGSSSVPSIKKSTVESESTQASLSEIPIKSIVAEAVEASDAASSLSSESSEIAGSVTEEVPKAAEVTTAVGVTIPNDHDEL
ncbi:unnamed protein product [Ambrosiozyma monospora]|uniref:Guanine nucleotide-exchange factor SEC12 n=1 Tax=Ambrosiozyma monospora TaxID=43982 RepID=A0A9W6YUG6_AMBMO|nr:unnamed protein product [Ambrosiozyma monospora]